jgi:hypothetical protein
LVGVNKIRAERLTRRVQGRLLQGKPMSFASLGNDKLGLFAAAADEVDDFQAVAVFQQRLRPTVTRHDGVVEFDGHAVGLHVERFDQGYEGKTDGRGRVR